eukprot:3438956-Lingulodinium_polyedra.AAC.1
MDGSPCNLKYRRACGRQMTTTYPSKSRVANASARRATPLSLNGPNVALSNGRGSQTHATR